MKTNNEKFDSNYNILIVEDDEVVSLLIDEISKKFIKKSIRVVNGLDGITAYNEYFETNQCFFDIVITDIFMPQMDGFTLVEEIRKINPSQEIVVMSSSNDSKSLERLIELEIKHFLNKPVVKEELITTLSNIIESIKIRNEKKEQDEKILQLNNELDTILNTFDKYVISLRTNKKGYITYVSQAYLELSGYTKDELINKKHSIMNHPNMPLTVFKDLWKTIKAGNVWHGEIQNKHKSGKSFWCDTTIFPLLNEDGQQIGYNSFITDITNKKQTEFLNKNLDSFITNIEQGFLTIDFETLRVNENFSKKCVEILNTDDIFGHELSYVLFENNQTLFEIFESAINEYKKTDDELAKELFLSLLPNENTINKLTFDIKYKVIENGKQLFIILTDITKEKKLEEKIKREQQLQKMIIAVATHKEETINLKNSFEDFLNKMYEVLNIVSNDVESDILILKRSLHTYKGQFLQKEMYHISDAIHSMETELSNLSFDMTHNIYKLVRFIKGKLSIALDKDLEIISNILGEEFLSGKTYLHISTDRVEKLETQMLDTLYNIKTTNKKPLYSLLDNISNLRHSSLVDLLGDYPHSVKSIASRLGKKIYPFKIEGDQNIFVEPSIKSFIETLVHVFRNAIDHGIEDIQTRHLKGKDPIGRVTCSVDKKGDLLYITITDDGCGIDINKVLKKAIIQGKIDKENANNYNDENILDIIFSDGFTTKDDITEISGRGIGLNTVLYELQKIHGEVAIKNQIDVGTSFIFTIPNTLEIKENSLITQSEENFILNSVVNASLDFLENNMNISIVSKYFEQSLHIEKHYSTIKYTYTNEVFCVVSMSTEVLTRICNVFLGVDDSATDEYEQIISSLPSEIANIVCGLAISKFQELDDTLTMSEPILFDKKIISNLAKNNNAISNIIETIYGNFICTIINISKE